MATVGAVWINVLPSMQGFANNLQKQATSAAKVAAVGAGKSMGTAMGDATVGAMTARMTAGMRQSSRRMQSTFTGSTNLMTRALGNFTAGWRDADAAASAFTGRMGAVGQAANRALLAPTRAVGQFAQGFADSRVAASAFGTRMTAVGGQTRAVLERSLDPLRTFAHGFTDARVAASALSGRMGTFGGVASNALGRLRDGWNDVDAGMSAFSGRLGTVGAVAGRALQPFVEGFRNADAAASVFSGRMGTLGGVARRATDAVAGGVARFGEGFSNANVAASVFSGRLGTMGGLVRSSLDAGVRSIGMLGTGLTTAGTTAVSAFGAMRTGVATAFSGVSSAVGAVATAGSGAAAQIGSFFSNAASSAATTIRNVLGGAIGQVTAMLGVIGLGSLGSQVASVASGAATTQAQIEALYGAAGGGAAEVTALMDGMAERFRGLDMGAMREGAVSLAYMGLQGEEAVGVLERLEKATTTTGSGSVGLSRAMSALTKGVNAGKFQMDSLNQISDAGIPIYDALSDVLGVDIPTAQQMASDGAIGLEEVLQALSGDYGTWFPALLEGADNVGQTFSGAWSTIKNTIVNGFAEQVIPLFDRATPLMLGLADKVEDGFSALPGVIGRVRDVFSQLMEDTGLDQLPRFFTGTIVPAVRDLWTAVQPLAIIIGGALVVGVRALMDGLKALGPVITSVTGWLADNRKWVTLVGVAVLGGVAAYYALGAATAIIKTITSVTKIWSGVQLAFNAIMAANPIMIIVIAIGALVAAAIYAYKNFEGFRDVVDRVWQAIKNAAMWIWERGLKPAFEGIMAGVKWVGDAVEWLWKSAIKPSWDAIVGAFDATKSGAGAALDWLTDAFTAIGDGAIWLWEKAIKPAFDFIWALIKNIITAIIVVVLIPWILAFKAIGALATWLWEKALKPVFKFIGDAAVWVWEKAIKPSWDFIIGGIKQVGEWFTWLWDNAIKPSIDFIADGAKWLWKNAIKPSWDFIVGGVKELGKWFKWLWGQIKAVFNWIAGHIRSWWTRTRAQFNLVIALVRGGLSTAFTWFRDRVIKPVWDFISRHINNIWNNGIKPAFDKVKEGVDAMKDAFNAGKDSIKKAWDGIRDSAKKPVNFLIDTVYNKGIMPLWNKVAGVVGATELKKVDTFADGGRTRGGIPGVDSIPALVMADEYVVKRDSARKIGFGTLDYINQTGELPNVPRFASGGRVGFPSAPSIPSGKKMLDAIKDFLSPTAIFSLGGDVITGDYEGAIDKVLKPARDITAEIGTKGFPGVPHQIVKTGGDRMKKKIRELVDSWNSAMEGQGGGPDSWVGIGTASQRLQAGARFARSQHGKAYQWGGNGNPSWDCSGFVSAIESVIRGQSAHRRWSTHAFSGSRAPAGWVQNLRSPYMIGVTHAGVGHTAGTLMGVNVESAGGGKGVVVGSRARGYRGFPYQYGFRPVVGDSQAGSGPGDTASLYDRGGYIQPGVSLVANRTGGPEPVLTAAQWRDMHLLAQSVGASEGGELMRDAHVHLYESEATVQEAFRRLDTELRKRRRGGVHAGRTGR